MVKGGHGFSMGARGLPPDRSMALIRKKKRGETRYFLIYVVRRYWRDEALDMASSLAYTSLLAMVPLLVIGLGLLTAFPRFESLRQDLLAALFRDMVPEVGAQVQAYVGRFAANAGRLTTLGIIGLVATAVMLLVAIEAALNRIFRVANQRATWSRIVTYWGALTLGPLLAGVGLTMSAWFAVLPWVRTMHHWAGRETTADLRDAVNAVSPFLVMTIAFTVLFFVTPNRRVRVTDALLGGVVAALLVLALRSGFALYIAAWGHYRPVYGAVATMPIFLAWVYLSWTAVLFGAEIAAALPERRRGRLDHADKALDARHRLALALALLAALSDETVDNGRGIALHRLTDKVGEGERPVAEALANMVRSGLVARRGRNRFGAGDGLATATLADLLRAMGMGLGPLVEGTSPESLSRIDAIVATAARAETASLQIPLRSLLAAPEAPA